jgi:hypothetical protein
MNELQLALPLVLTFAVLAASNLDIMLRTGFVAMLVGSSLPVLAVTGKTGLTICLAVAVACVVVGGMRTIRSIR